MLTIEQVAALESRVGKAVALITKLKTENASLRNGLHSAETRIAELEANVAVFQKDQARIEAGIVEALKKLDFFEDSVHEPPVAAKESLAVNAAMVQGSVNREPVMEKVSDTDTLGETPEALDIF